MVDIEKSKKLAELSKESTKLGKEVEHHKKLLETSIRNGREGISNRIHLEYATKEYDRVKRELNKLM